MNPVFAITQESAIRRSNAPSQCVGNCPARVRTITYRARAHAIARKSVRSPTQFGRKTSIANFIGAPKRSVGCRSDPVRHDHFRTILFISRIHCSSQPLFMALHALDGEPALLRCKRRFPEFPGRGWFFCGCADGLTKPVQCGLSISPL